VSAVSPVSEASVPSGVDDVSCATVESARVGSDDRFAELLHAPVSAVTSSRPTVRRALWRGRGRAVTWDRCRAFARDMSRA